MFVQTAAQFIFVTHMGSGNNRPPQSFYCLSNIRAQMQKSIPVKPMCFMKNNFKRAGAMFYNQYMAQPVIRTYNFTFINFLFKKLFLSKANDIL